jgi:hypothetical protein
LFMSLRPVSLRETLEIGHLRHRIR